MRMSDTRLLIRISEVFGDLTGGILEALGAREAKRLGAEYFLARVEDAESARSSEAWKFVRWSLPVEHAWPCNPEKMEGFVEKAAQGLAGKFAGRKAQAVLIGPLDGANRYYRMLASNLRGRLLQVLTDHGGVEVEALEPEVPVLFCLVGKEGVYAGMASPREANGFYPGGTKFIRQGSAETISRAGAKIAEALHFLRLFRERPVAGSHWLELGASPGGMTSELLERGYRVTAVDRAELDVRLKRAKGLNFLKRDVAEYVPPAGEEFDALLSDMNGDPREALRQVLRLARWLKPRGLVVFTLKTTGEESLEGICRLHREVTAEALRKGMDLLATTHLTYNRQEFTLLFAKAAA